MSASEFLYPDTVYIQRCCPVAHHISTNEEFVVFHQSLKGFDPILAQSLLERLERFRYVSIRAICESVETLELALQSAKTTGESGKTYSGMIIPPCVVETLYGSTYAFSSSNSTSTGSFSGSIVSREVMSLSLEGCAGSLR